MEIQIKGIEDIVMSVEKMIGIDSLESAMGKACALIEGDAKENAPKREGHLRRSMDYVVENKGDVIEGTVFNSAEYAPYVEYGTGLFAEEGNGRKDVPWHYQDEKGEWHSTKGQHPQPFLRPAFNANKDNITKIIQGGMKNG